MEGENTVLVWGAVKKLGYRFAFVYIALYLLVVLGNVGARPLLMYYEQMWRAIVPWVGKHILHLEKDITTFTGGSGDTTYDWVRALCTLVLAALVALVWSLIDRRRPNYERLDVWLRVAVRFSVLATMVVYGAAKAIPTQMPSPTLDRLLQPYGDSSPMGLLWTFLGASKPYQIFTGITELLGGLLLMSRRTTSLGALVTAGVMGNVFMMNMSYDVPVKLLSFHVVLLSVYLLWPDAKRLANVFVLNRAAEPAKLPQLFVRTKWHRGALALRAVVTIAFVANAFYGTQQVRYRFGDLSPRSPLMGIWDVEEFAVEGKMLPPLTTDTLRWKRLVFERPQFMTVYAMNDARLRYGQELKMEEKSLTLTKPNDKEWKAMLTVAQPEPELLQLEGTFEGKTVKARLRKMDHVKRFLLINRGFHWISEFPFNR